MLLGLSPLLILFISHHQTGFLSVNYWELWTVIIWKLISCFRRSKKTQNSTIRLASDVACKLPNMLVRTVVFKEKANWRAKFDFRNLFKHSCNLLKITKHKTLAGLSIYTIRTNYARFSLMSRIIWSPVLHGVWNMKIFYSSFFAKVLPTPYMVVNHCSFNVVTIQAGNWWEISTSCSQVYLPVIILSRSLVQLVICVPSMMGACMLINVCGEVSYLILHHKGGALWNPYAQCPCVATWCSVTMR